MIAFEQGAADCRVRGELTFATVAAELPTFKPSTALTVDLGAVTKADSAAIAWMLACRQAALAKDATVRFSHTPQRLQELIRVYGLGELLQ